MLINIRVPEGLGPASKCAHATYRLGRCCFTCQTFAARYIFSLATQSNVCAERVFLLAAICLVDSVGCASACAWLAKFPMGMPCATVARALPRLDHAHSTVPLWPDRLNGGWSSGCQPRAVWRRLPPACEFPNLGPCISPYCFSPPLHNPTATQPAVVWERRAVHI